MIQTTKHEKGLVVVRPGVERLTAVNAGAFKSEVAELIDAGSSQLVIDFEEVTFLDSSGLGALVGIMKKMGHRGDISVCSLDEELKIMFKISRMDRVFTSFPDAKSAVSKLSERL
ncbi:STAS domain-containing protein [Planktotalea sp.]|uniref:STAS domain-containing protein n=1 Tax=Planktotalea sp. TaxID=2029877 RepID=UPI003D6A36A1